MTDSPPRAEPERPWQPLAPERLPVLFAATDAPWWIAGGMAIDLFVGHATREHVDLDVAILREDQCEFFEVLGDWELFVAHDGRLRALEEREREEGIPEDRHVLWCRSDPGRPWSLELLLEDNDEEEWVFRRDPRVRASLDEIEFESDDGLPFLAPELPLLYKAKSPREKDEADLDACLPLLDDASRRWLRDALRLAYPGHAWLERKELV